MNTPGSPAPRPRPRTSWARECHFPHPPPLALEPQTRPYYYEHPLNRCPRPSFTRVKQEEPETDSSSESEADSSSESEAEPKDGSPAKLGLSPNTLSSLGYTIPITPSIPSSPYGDCSQYAPRSPEYDPPAYNQNAPESPEYNPPARPASPEVDLNMPDVSPWSDTPTTSFILTPPPPMEMENEVLYR